MRRTLVAVLLVLLAGALALGVGRLSLAPGNVYTYTVPEVVAGLARHPSAWVGRTILVRGRVLQAEVWEPPRIWPTVTPGKLPAIMPGVTRLASLVGSPPMGCLTAA
jgi:hypothetical protein